MTEVIKVEDCNKNIGDYDIPIYNAVIIPNGATNGDMIKLVFNAEDIGLDYFRNQWGVHMADGYDRYFNLDWWNAPYEGGKENEKRSSHKNCNRFTN